MDPHDEPNYKTWAGLAEAFQIFSKYGKGEYRTQAEHDVIYAGPSPNDVSSEDRKRLKEIGWHEDEEGPGCFGYFT